MSGADEQAPTVDVPSFFYHLTRNSQGGTIYLKAVNAVGTRQPLRMQISGASAVEPTGEAVEMKGEGTEDTNSISEPTKIVPVAHADPMRDLGLPPPRCAPILPELVLSSLGHGEYAQRGWARVGPERAITAVLHRARSPDERPDSRAGSAMIRHN